METADTSEPEPRHFRWQVQGVLAGCARPGWQASEVGEDVVAAWVAGARAEGIESVICLLDAGQLACYSTVTGGLLGGYIARGLSVQSVPTRDEGEISLDNDDMKNIMKAFRRLPQPVLIHGNAGRDRTAAALDYVGNMLEQQA
jgi:hypothetical protein